MAATKVSSAIPSHPRHFPAIVRAVGFVATDAATGISQSMERFCLRWLEDPSSAVDGVEKYRGPDPQVQKAISYLDRRPALYGRW